MPIIKYVKKTIFILLIIFLLSNMIVFYYGFKLLEPVDEENINSEIFEIEQGQTVSEIIDDLYKLGLIQDPAVFEIYLRIKDLSTKLQAGHYSLNTSMPAQKIAGKLVEGETMAYRISIPEGVRVYDVADRLAETDINREKFLQLVKEKQLDFFPEDIELVNYNLEGFLFPETYYIPYSAGEEEIINLMIREFEKQIKPLKDAIRESPLELYEIVTIASLIEGEVILRSEMPIVASVIYNRLDINMRLQLDATVQYILEEHKSRILYSDLRIESPYNTYRHNGLPPGPINNPGLAAIKAVLNPDETDYLYYVAAGDGGHIFTETYREHLNATNRVRSYR